MQVGDDQRPHRIVCRGRWRPLDGLLVADFSRVLAGPLAAMLLGDLGADVIKVERPDGGDDTRAWGPPWRGDDATYYLGLNRNKRSVALDLGDAGDRALARRLGERADVLIESFRPGLMARGAWTATRCARCNPGLVVLLGDRLRDAARRPRGLPGYDFLLQAMGGLMSVTGEADGRPLKVGAAVVDLVCGLLAVAASRPRCVERARTGRGRHVEVSLMDAALTSLLNQGVGVGPRPASCRARRGNRHPSIVPYETYAAADRPLADRRRQRPAVRAPVRGGRAPELAADQRFVTNAARVEHADALAERLEAALRTRPAEAWIAVLRAAGVPGRPDQRRRRGLRAGRVARAGADRRGGRHAAATPPLRLDGERPPVRRPPPRLDEHGDEVRAWLAEWLAGPAPPAACRIGFGSMKRTSSRSTSNSATSLVPRARKKSTSRWTSSSGALAPEEMPTTRSPGSHSSRTSSRCRSGARPRRGRARRRPAAASSRSSASR